MTQKLQIIRKMAEAQKLTPADEFGFICRCLEDEEFYRLHCSVYITVSDFIDSVVIEPVS